MMLKKEHRSRAAIIAYRNFCDHFYVARDLLYDLNSGCNEQEWSLEDMQELAAEIARANYALKRMRTAIYGDEER